MNVNEALRVACADVGILFRDVPTDGRWHGTDVEGDHRGRGDGRIKLFPDGQGGIVWNWKGETRPFFTDDGRKLTEVERRELDRKQQEAIRQSQEEAARKSAAIWKAAVPAPNDHAYLLEKGIKTHGLRLHKGALVIPMRDSAGLHSLQFIGPDGVKRFLTGGRVSGCYFPIGELDGALCIAEGYATGASVHEATGYAVAVAFFAGNLLPVALSLRAMYPDMRLILCADDDAKKPGNPGLTKAREAAQAVGALLAVPDFGDNRPEGVSDFNDLARERGAEAIAACIANATAPAKAELRPAAKNAPQVSIITAEGTPRPQATVLIDIGRTHTLFHDLGGDAYARLGNGAVCAIGSGEYREVLGGEFYKLSGKGANRNALADAVTTLAAIAKHEDDAAQVFLRVGKSDGGIVIDTGRKTAPAMW